MPAFSLLCVYAAALPRDRARLGALIADAQPDVVCVHGAPSLLRWRSKCAALAREAGMVVLGGGRTGGGNLLLSALGVDEVGVREISFGRGPRPPGAAIAALRLLGDDFVLAGARFAVGQAGRVQAEELVTAVGTVVPGSPPALLCAEGAHLPNTPPWRVLGAGFVTVGNGVFVDPRITVDDVAEFGPGPARIQAERRPLRVQLTI